MTIKELKKELNQISEEFDNYDVIVTDNYYEAFLVKTADLSIAEETFKLFININY